MSTEKQLTFATIWPDQEAECTLLAMYMWDRLSEEDRHAAIAQLKDALGR